MTKMSETYNGNAIYYVDLVVPYDGVSYFQFQRFNSEGTYEDGYGVHTNDGEWYSQSNFSGKLYIGHQSDAHRWMTYCHDATYYFIKTGTSSSWDGAPNAHAWNAAQSTYATTTWPGIRMTDSGKTYKGKNIYSITFNNPPYSMVKFNNYSNTNNQSGEKSLPGNEGKIFDYEADNWLSYAYDHQVIFDGNDNTGGSMTAQTMPYNTATAINANGFTKTGYTFTGWNTKANGSGTSYAAGANITVTDSDVKLYAQWAKQSLTITAHPDYLSQTEKLNLTIRYENIPEGYCFRVHELRTNGYYNNEAQGAYNPISGTGSATYTSSAYLPTGDVDRIVVELWKINPFEKQSVVSNEVAVTVEQEWRVDVKAKTDGLISTVGGTVSPASVSPTAHKGQTITAEANVGYKFTGWTANTANITFENASELSTTVYATASGTVYANYVSSVNIFLPNTHNNWNTSDVNWKFNKLPGEVGNTVTLAVDINKSDYASSNYQLGFNIFHADWEYKWWHNKSDGDSNMDAHNCTDWGFNTKDGNYKTNLDLNVSGTYTFTLKNSDNSSSQKLSVTYPDKSFIEGAFPMAWSEDDYTLTEEGDIQSVTINITSTGDKQFRLVSHGKLFGTSTKITAAANSQTLSAKKMTDGGAVMTLDAYVTGAYTFTYNKSTKNLTVTFPTAYTVTYGVGTKYSSMGGVSTSPNITSGDYVIAGTNITFTATPNLGYKFVGWYNNEACTGDAISTNATHNIASLNANTTLYAKFDYRPLYIHADFAPNGWDTPVQMTQSTENRAVYTYEIDPLAAKSGAPASEGHHFHFVNTVENPNGNKAYNYKGVQTPTGSGFLTNENIHLTDEKNATIQFDLMRKSKITITLTLKSIDDDPKPTVDIAADPYYTVHTATGGSGAAGITINPTSVEARSGANSAAITATIAPGYTFVNWTPDNSNITINSPNDPTTTVRATGEGTLIANATANSYTVHFDGNGNTGGSMSDMPARTYGVAFNLPPNGFTKTGYTFAGWALSANDEVRYADEEEVSNLTKKNNGTATLYAKWTQNQYTVTLDKQTSAEGYGGNAGSVTDQTVTFDATPATVTGIRLTAKNGWAFMGFYSAKDGGGRQFINPSGEWVANAGDTIRDSKWVHDGDVTLYAYYKKAEITDLIFDAAVVAPSASVGVTPKVDPTPEGTNSICWKLLYNNGNLYTPQPNFENPRGIANKVTFTAPNTSGMYLVAAVLRTGSSCDGGTKLDSVTYPFQVAGDHTVTVQYKCGDVTLQGSTSVSARPLDWSTEITPDDIFGYTFEKWVAGDGVSMTIDGGETTINTGGETSGKDGTHAVQIKAIYDGKLIAQYTKKNIIYFKNTLGWSEVYVNLYPHAWWDKDKGAGNNTLADDKKNKKMTQIGETDIWYYEYGNTATTAYVSFTDRSQNNYAGFAGTSSVNKVQVSYPTRPYATEDEDANYGFNAGTPMFVPTAGQTAQPWNKSGNNDLAEYYNKGYWRKYDPIQGETGYTLKVYNKTSADGRTELKSIKFVESDVPGQLFKAVADLEAAGEYGIKFERDNSMLYTNISGHLQSTGDVVVTEKQNANYRAIWIKATAAGDYTFAITINGDGKLCIQAEFPVAPNDYRVIYTDNDTWTTTHTLESWVHPSRIISAEENAVDTISFFVSKGHSPEFKIQQVISIDEGTGAITWKDVTDWISCDDVDASGVYNFIFTQDGSKNISFTKKEPYTGNFYIRTDAAGSTKWDNYRSDPDHLMTYSEYSKDHSDYTHYFVKFVREGTNVKFVVANDYSPCISDTLIRQTYRGGDSDHVDENGFLNGDLPGDGVNVRYMWDIRNNAVYRAYLAPAQSDGSNFLVLRGTDSDNLKDENGNPLRNASNSGQDGYNHKAPDHCIQFVDNENWIYEATVQVEPSSYVKLYAFFHSDNFYYKGTEDDTFDDTHAIKLVEGSGNAVKVRVIYDFKTDRLVAAYLPSGNIDEQMAINADVMFIREHQGDIDQLTFSEKDSKMGAITNIETAYAVMRFNKWTLNNKEKTGSHNPLASPASIYERSLYYVSFPFPVNLSEVFGFGTYGQHWIIQRYRGDLRAQQGFWAESAGFWEFIWNRNGVVLQPNEGYILTLETELLGEESDVWGPDQRSNQIELFFPSTGPLGSITNASVTQTLPAHTCTIDKTKDQFGNPTGLLDSPNPSTSYNRKVFDSHWNIMSVPTYVNVDDPNFVNTTWIGGEKGNVGPKFLYTWNMDDNTLTATSGKGFMYHAMHAYTVQYYGDVTWTTSVTPPVAPQRNTEYRGEYEFCLEVQQDDQMIDRTYVRLSDDENVTTGFEFSEDMTKQFNSRKANIFTIAGNTSLGGNSLPLSTTQTTVVPVGVKIKTAGDYTFAIPEGTDGIGVTLVDNETGVRTLLSALDYTVNLTAGTHDQRFVLEISPIQNTPTGIEDPTSDSSLKGRAQKRIIDGVLYIVKDGKIFDARGTRVE